MDPRRQTWQTVWRDLDPAVRREVAVSAFEHPVLSKHATLALAQHDRVRRQSVQRWPMDRKATRLARVRKLADPQLVGTMLTNFHMYRRSAMLTELLDFLHLPHDRGVLRDVESLKPPGHTRLVAAIERMMVRYPWSHVALMLDVLACQRLPVWRDLPSARSEAGLDARAPERMSMPPPPSELITGRPRERQENRALADETPFSFTTLDEVLIKTVLASIAEVHGALLPEKVEDLLEEVIQLNLDRHHSYYHRGFYTVLRGKEIDLDFPEASATRRAWYACGAILGYERRNELPKVVDLLASRADIFQELGTAGSGYAERVARVVFEAFADRARYAEAARFLSPELVVAVGSEFAQRILETASGLIRERREADARRLLEVLLAAVRQLEEDPDLPHDFPILLHRRRAHCARLRGDFAGARSLLTPLLARAAPEVRSDILADLGLVECGLRSLADVSLPEDESLLVDFARQFEKGWALFLESSRVGGGGRNHGDFCLGVASFARGEVDEAVPYLERAVAGMSADPERYGRFGPLDHARMALSVTLAEQTDMARVPYVRDLMREVFRSQTQVKSYVLRRVLSAVELVDEASAIEVAREAFAQTHKRSLPALIETRMLRYVPEALDELLRLARRPTGSVEKRFDYALAVLEESHSVRDLPELSDQGAHGERAVEAFDVLVELAAEERERRRVLELLSEEQGAWRSVMEPLDAQVLKATLYEAMGLQENAAAALAQAFHATLDADDEWSLAKAEALYEDIQVLGGEEAAAPLAHRLKQTREVFERRSRSSAMLPLSEVRADAEDEEEEFYGLILIVGGNETQETQDTALLAWAKQRWPQASFSFRRTGWSSNWGDQLKGMESELERARAVVIMRYIRTSLGQALRKRAGELDVPWVACASGGRASMQRAVEEAVLLAKRHSG